MSSARRRPTRIWTAGLAAAALLNASVLHGIDPQTYTRNVAVIIHDGVELMDWAGPYAVFNIASFYARSNGKAAFSIYTVSDTKKTVKSQPSINLEPDYSIQDAPQPDILVIPGGGLRRVLRNPAFFEWTKGVAERSEITFAVCTGSFILGQTGLLDGLAATGGENFRRQHPKVSVRNGSRFTDTGRYVTTGPVTSGIDAAFHLVARLLGRRVADQVAADMAYRWAPEPEFVSTYHYLNPSTDERGRAAQQADMQREEKNFSAAIENYRILLSRNPDDFATWRSLAVSLQATGAHKDAAEAFLRAAREKAPSSAYTLYSAACEYGLANDRERAIAALEQAVAAGYTDLDAARLDPALASIRDDPRVRRLGR